MFLFVFSCCWCFCNTWCWIGMCDWIGVEGILMRRCWWFCRSFCWSGRCDQIDILMGWPREWSRGVGCPRGCSWCPLSSKFNKRGCCITKLGCLPSFLSACRRYVVFPNRGRFYSPIGWISGEQPLRLSKAMISFFFSGSLLIMIATPAGRIIYF